MRLATILLACLLVPLAATPALAQTPGSCLPGTAEADLDISGVFARVFNGGNLFFGNATLAGNGYLVPKASGNSPIFAAGIWVGGLIGGDLRVAGSTYADFEFWPGPLEDGATLPDPTDCSAFDRIWKVDVLDLQQYDATGDATADLAEWPVDLGAPVTDGDGVEGNYNLEGGDRPTVYGTQTLFWVMNDVGNVHANTLTEPIGLEVRVSAFSSVESDLSEQTFYRYELVNRNSEPFEAARFGLFVDPDLGSAADDYIGSDSTRSMAFVYNEDDTDPVYGIPPAAGYDFLSGAAASTYFIGGGVAGTSDPNNGQEVYNHLNGLWTDGTPITEGLDGYQTGGPVTTWAFPGDPVTEQFWSEINTDGQGGDNAAGDRRNTIASEAFTLAPGESRTFDLAILFGQGADNFDSITELRAVSDAVQARYDAEMLFVPGPPPPPPGALATPSLLAPEDGAFFVDTFAELSWSEVPGADFYRVEIATDEDFADAEVIYREEASAFFSMDGANEAVTYFWRVRAFDDDFESSLYSETRSFGLYTYAFDFFGDGVGIVETAAPGGDVCPPGSDDPGCQSDDYDGNTVWVDPNSAADYLVTAPNNSLASDGLGRFFNVIDGEDFELRFTAECATPGACLGAYGFSDNEITSVPFALWNTGSESTPDDDVRMIPFVLNTGDGGIFADWADVFTDTQEVPLDGGIVEVPISQRVYWMMPDRPDGYDRFADAANAAGGPGALYPVENDPDTQIDIDPNSGEACANQGLFIDFCYRGAGTFVYPLGRMLVADLAGDGTTPPAGTTVRFDAPERLFVDAEDDAPTQPEAFAIEAAYPNPFASVATVEYQLGEASDVRLAVFDVLGRRVATLAEGPQSTGSHRAVFEASGLASGVYLVVLEADGQRTSRKVMLVR